jgi:hypothetical protein
MPRCNCRPLWPERSLGYSIVTCELGQRSFRTDGLRQAAQRSYLTLVRSAFEYALADSILTVCLGGRQPGTAGHAVAGEGGGVGVSLGGRR